MARPAGAGLGRGAARRGGGRGGAGRARLAPPRAWAAAAGAWAPVLLDPAIGTSGSAEPLAAFLLAAAAGLFQDRRQGAPFPWTAAAALGALGVTKHEGTVMAVLVAVAALGLLPRRHRAPFLAAALGPAAAWHLAARLAGIPGLPAVFDAARMVERAAAMPSALLGAASPSLVFELAVLLLALACPAVARPLRLTLAAWLAVMAAVYLVSAGDLQWLVATSLERVLAIPLPMSLAALIGATFLHPA